MDYTIKPIEAAELATIRSTGLAAGGVPNEEVVLPAGQQLRCCLRRSQEGEKLLLISYAPLAARRPWRETGPVFVHAGSCPELFDGELPGWLDEGPRVLRAYDTDGAMLYQHNHIVAAGDGVRATLEMQFAAPEVAEVHLRNELAQCYIAKAVRR